MAISESQLKATKKYQQKFDTIVTRVPAGEKEIIVKHAQSQGESTTRFVCRAIRETMERDQEKE